MIGRLVFGATKVSEEDESTVSSRGILVNWTFIWTNVAKLLLLRFVLSFSLIGSNM